MQTCLRHGIIALALVSTIGTVAGQTVPEIVQDRQQGIEPGSQLQLTPAQKTAIFNAVRQTNTKVTAPPAVTLPLSVGAQLPPSIELRVLPDGALAQAPKAKILQYTVLENQVVLVDPTTMRVVDIIRQ
jgi:hypothetical protein